MFLIITVIVFALLAVADTVVLVLLWRQNEQLTREISHVTAISQRHEREITQQRYALALLRQMQKGEASAQSDEAILETAASHLDELATLEAAAPATPVATEAVGNLSDKEILQFVRRAIQNNQLAISRQPIVTLPKREVRYYEIFSRILVGDQGYIPANKFIGIARNNNLMNVMDNLLLLRCLQLIKQSAQAEQSAGFFVNISSQTLGNKAYVNDLIEFLQQNPKLSTRLVFEMTQQDTLNIPATTKTVMEGLALLGCRFSMDQVTMLGMDTDRLVDLNINFVKMDSRLLEKEMDNTLARGRIKKIKNMLGAQGIQMILEKVENEKQLLSLIDLYADYGQGYLFGQPEILA